MNRIPFPVRTGCTQPVQVLAIKGQLAVVTLLDVADHPVAIVRIGAVASVPGYEPTWVGLVQNQIHPGDQATITWIGMDQDGLACVGMEVGGAGATSSAPDRHQPDLAALRAGLVVPLSLARNAGALTDQYRIAFADGARHHRGAWADTAVDLKKLASDWIGQDHQIYRPSYLAAHPALCLSIGMVLLGGVAWTMLSDNRSLLHSLDADAPWWRKGLRGIFDVHTRFFKLSHPRPSDPNPPT